nr:LOW QUALITY PROTEIN: NUT family member 2G-like [Vicugna pacos]
MGSGFMEFEAEEMQIQQVQWMQRVQGLPPPAPPKPEPRGPSPKSGPSVRFMEFEAEEMQIQQVQWMQRVQGLPPPAPPKPEPQGTQPKKWALSQGVTGLSASTAIDGSQLSFVTLGKLHRSQCPWEAMAPKKNPPEAVKEHVDIMEELVGPVPSATGEEDAEFQEDRNELKQEENGTYTDPRLLSYTDKLCSQEACITKVEAVIHPRFLADLLSPEPQLDLLALAEELEQEAGLTLEQLVQKGLLALKEELGVRAHTSHSVTH